MISHQWSHTNEFPQEAVKTHMKKFDHSFSSQPLLLYSSLIFKKNMHCNLLQPFLPDNPKNKTSK